MPYGTNVLIQKARARKKEDIYEPVYMIKPLAYGLLSNY